jgi:hypothetical protein
VNLFGVSEDMVLNFLVSEVQKPLEKQRQVLEVDQENHPMIVVQKAMAREKKTTPPTITRMPPPCPPPRRPPPPPPPPNECLSKVKNIAILVKTEDKKSFPGRKFVLLDNKLPNLKQLLHCTCCQ